MNGNLGHESISSLIVRLPYLAAPILVTDRFPQPCGSRLAHGITDGGLAHSSSDFVFANTGAQRDLQQPISTWAALP